LKSLKIGKTLIVKYGYNSKDGSGNSRPSTCDKLQNLAGKGVKIVIGPDSSTEVEAVKTYANENNILLVS
jgi:branched-chain amino acid transport system substrate-binding protein